jgi:hypothetical protein
MKKTTAVSNMASPGDGEISKARGSMMAKATKEAT